MNLMFPSCAGRAMVKYVVVAVLLRRPRVDHGSIHMEFVVNKVGQVFSSENTGVTVSFLHMLHTHISFIHHHNCISFAINSFVKQNVYFPLALRSLYSRMIMHTI